MGFLTANMGIMQETRGWDGMGGCPRLKTGRLSVGSWKGVTYPWSRNRSNAKLTRVLFGGVLNVGSMGSISGNSRSELNISLYIAAADGLPETLTIFLDEFAVEAAETVQNEIYGFRPASQHGTANCVHPILKNNFQSFPISLFWGVPCYYRVIWHSGKWPVRRWFTIKNWWFASQQTVKLPEGDPSIIPLMHHNFVPLFSQFFHLYPPTIMI